MIAASIALAFALYFSGLVVVQTTTGIAFNQPRQINGQAVIACLAWAVFYYFTHA